MKLQDLVIEARKKDKRFNKMFKQRILMKTNMPLNWLMVRLEGILGKEYVRDAAKKHIEESSAES